MFVLNYAILEVVLHISSSRCQGKITPDRVITQDNFMQDCCSRSQDYHNGGDRLNSTSVQGKVIYLSTEVS